MLPRALEVLLVALLVMLTLGVAFDFQNHALLRDILEELRRQPERLAVNPGTPAAPTAAKNPPPIAAAAPQQPAPAPTALVQPQPVTPSDNAVAVATPRPQPAPPDTRRPDPSPSVPTEDTGDTDHPPVRPPVAAVTPAPRPPVTPVTTPIAKPPASPPAPAPGPADDETWQRVGPIMSQIIEELLGGRYDDVVARFNGDMHASLTRQGIAAAIEPVRSEHGQMKRITHHRLPATGSIPANLVCYEVGVEMADGHPLFFTITLDAKQRISGLLMW